MAEIPLYSDTNFTTIIRRPDWPFDLLPSLADNQPNQVKLAAIARVRWCGEVPNWDIEQPIATDDGSYHGGDLGDEIAGLISLLYGVRCRSGGELRRWLPGTNGVWDDPLGQPFEIGHRPPVWIAPHRRRTVLPMPPRTAAFSDEVRRIESIANLDQGSAVALIRAARLYSNALWIADSDPNMAWLQLVSAIEVVAVSHSATTPAWKRVEVGMPKVWAALVSISDTHAQQVGKMLAHLVKSTDRFLRFLEEFAPQPPMERPQFEQFDWSNLPDACRAIYDYRSRALHGGTPFPRPMCEPPMVFDDGVSCEMPTGLASSDGVSTWRAEDLPMHLHLFEYITRGSLLSWWDSKIM